MELAQLCILGMATLKSKERDLDLDGHSASIFLDA